MFIPLVDLSKSEVQKAFDPGHRRHRFKLWVRLTSSNPPRVLYHLYWKRIGMFLAGLAVAGWLAGATAVWSFVKYRRGYTGVQWVDIAFFPVRAQHYRAGLGRHLLALGRTELEKQNYREGYSLLRAGLDRVPGDLAARREVALMQARFGMVAHSLDTLTAGATTGREDFDYLNLMFGMLLEAQEDERAVALARELLPAAPDGKLTHQFVALQAAIAHHNRGRPDAARSLVAAWKLENSLEGQILLARCEWDQGERDTAIRRLVGQIDRFPKRDELYLQLVRLTREADRVADARRYALLRQFNQPDNPTPRIDLLHTYRATGDRAAEAREIDAYLGIFAQNDRALLQLAGFAAETGQPDLAARLAREASLRKLPGELFLVAHVQALVVALDYRTAADLSKPPANTGPEPASYPRQLLNGLHALALLGLGEASEGELQITKFIGETRLRANDALLFAKRLLQLGSPASARRALERACALDPLHQEALTELIRLDTLAGHRAGLVEHLPKLLRMRRPPRQLLEECLLRLDQAEDNALRAQIKTVIEKSGSTPVS